MAHTRSQAVTESNPAANSNGKDMKDTPSISVNELRRKPKSKSKRKEGTIIIVIIATDFPQFPKLPVEIQQMIIKEAVVQDQTTRSPKMILFDHNTYRISPLVELKDDLSPMLFVNTQFRKAALEVYVPVEVIEVEIPHRDMYGDPTEFHNDDGDLEYDLEVARMVDAHAEGKDEAALGHVGRIYIRPSTDIFLTGLIPRQISNCADFSSLIDESLPEDDPLPEAYRWTAPICHITERLPPSVCAKISSMRELVWDPRTVCPSCGRYHDFHCVQCFIKGRGQSLLTGPRYDTAVYPSIQDHGLYVMGGIYIPEVIMYDLATGTNAVKTMMQMWDRLIFTKAQHVTPPAHT